MVTRNSLLWALALCAGVAVTNRYTDYDADRELIGQAAGDSYSYFAIAESVPGLPHDTLAFHHSQSMALPYLVGVVHRVAPVSIHRAFQLTVFALEIAILLVCATLLAALSVRGSEAGVMLAMLALSPWAFRYYVTFPEMLNDLGFVLGLGVLLLGLFSGRIGTVVAGQLIASLSRQTGLLLVPFVCVWIWRDRQAWERHARSGRIATCAVVAACAAGVYAATAAIAAPFSAPSENRDHILGLASWLTHDIDLAVLEAFALRMVAPVAIPFAFLAGLIRYPKVAAPDDGRIGLLIFGSVCCWVQPILAGPGITGGNAERLVSLGLVPLVLALAVRIRDVGGLRIAASTPRCAAMIAVLGAGSLHHVYTSQMLTHPGTRTGFAALYAVACAGLFSLVFWRGPAPADAAEEPLGTG